MKTRPSDSEVARYADMLAAIGTAPRLRILRLLLSSHPEGMVVGDIQGELEIPGPTLSHHLEKLRNEGLVSVRRERQYLRYAANAEALRELLAFLYEECCSRSKAIRTDEIIALTRSRPH